MIKAESSNLMTRNIIYINTRWMFPDFRMSNIKVELWISLLNHEPKLSFFTESVVYKHSEIRILKLTFLPGLSEFPRLFSTRNS